MRGEIVIEAPVRKGMVLLGSHTLGIKDPLYSRTIWEVSGKLLIKGSICIGRGSKICIGEDARLTLGDNFVITGNSEIICQKEITFGNDCLLSWDILMMDTDFHHIINENGEITNQSKPIKIGNHVWLGCRSTILKGVTIADNNVISANSTITKNCLDENCIIGGQGNSQEILRQRIEWAQ
jgi:acetyltransferase-like isoleucine patch superfamily enzyme